MVRALLHHAIMYCRNISPRLPIQWAEYQDFELTYITIMLDLQEQLLSDLCADIAF